MNIWGTDLIPVYHRRKHAAAPHFFYLVCMVLAWQDKALCNCHTELYKSRLFSCHIMLYACCDTMLYVFNITFCDSEDPLVLNYCRSQVNTQHGQWAMYGLIIVFLLGYTVWTVITCAINNKFTIGRRKVSDYRLIWENMIIIIFLLEFTFTWTA